MNTKAEIELISHCIEFMGNKEAIKDLFRTKGLKISGTYKNLAEEFEAHPHSITVAEITDLFRSIWEPCDAITHIANLKSGLLKGHDWHGAMPSILHRSIQDRVRECSAGSLTLEDYLAIGADIFKHEYFMVATHDICESAIIQSNASVIPPIGNKSITDFVYDGIPYDLKVSSHTDGWVGKAGKMTKDEKKQLAFELYKGADTERMRADAEKCKNNWGLNRLYYLVADQDKWIKDPVGTVKFLLDSLSNPDNYFDIEVNGYTIHIGLIEQ